MSGPRNYRNRRKAMRIALIERDGDFCHYCERKVYIGPVLWPRPKNECSIEHLKTLAEGGTSDLDNCVIACLECNNLRDAKRMSVNEFKQFIKRQVFV